MIRSERAAVIVTLVACGRVAFDPLRDSWTDGLAPLSDAGPFEQVRPIAELAAPGVDDDPTATGDLLELYFSSNRAGTAGGRDIFRATRASQDDVWQAPQPVVELNSTSADQGPGITPDGLEIYFTSARSGDDDVWYSVRATRSAAWSTPVRIAELSTQTGDFQAQPTASGLRLVMYRSRDLIEYTRPSGGPWSAPIPIDSLNSPVGDRSPCLDGSELGIVFSSDRDSGMTDIQDLYIATRPSVDAPFASPAPITAANTVFDDDDPWLSLDGRVLLFSSDRSGNSELYEVRR